MRFPTAFAFTMALASSHQIAEADPARPIAPEPEVFSEFRSPAYVHVGPPSKAVSWVPFGVSLAVGLAGMGVGIWAEVTAPSSGSAKVDVVAPSAFAIGSAALLLALPFGIQAARAQVGIGVGSIVVNGAF